MKLRNFLVLAVVMLFFLASVGISEGAEDEKIVIGSLIATYDIEHFIDMLAAQYKAADDLGFELVAYNSDWDPAKQTKQIEDLIAQNVDGIYIVPVDSKALIPAIKKCNEANIPVVVADITLDGWNDPERDYEIVSFVGSDSWTMGRWMGFYAADFLTEKYGEPKGKVGSIGFPVISTMFERNAGFKDIIANLPNIDLVIDRDLRELRFDIAKALAEDILPSYTPGSIDVIYASNETASLPFALTLMDMGRDDIAIITTDYTTQLVEAIKDPNNPIKASTSQSPTAMGRVGIEALLKAINGEEVAPRIPTETELLTVDTVDSFMERQAKIQEEIGPYKAKIK